jgi:hypothetical protein
VRKRQTKCLAAAGFLALFAGLIPSNWVGQPSQPLLAHAQNIGQRVVIGTVVDATSEPIPGATVFLKDLKTKLIRSFTSDAKGKFRFTQVDMAEDHEIWAEKDGRKSPVKTVSEWDARKEFETELKLK